MIRPVLILSITAQFLSLPTPVYAQVYDVLILGGQVVDGTGSERFRADVAIRGDRIVSVSRKGIEPSQAHTVIEANGRVVTPGSVSYTHLTLPTIYSV